MSKRKPTALAVTLPVVALLVLPACKLFKPNAGSEDKSLLVGNKKNSLLLVPDNLLEASAPAVGADKPAVCAYRLQGTGPELKAKGLSGKGVTLTRFVTDLGLKAPELFPWTASLAKFAHGLLDGFAREVVAKPASNLSDDMPAQTNAQTTAETTAPTSAQSGYLGAAPSGHQALLAAAKEENVKQVIALGIENQSCMAAVAGDPVKQAQCKESLGKRLMSMLTNFGKVAAGKVLEIPANVLQAKSNALAAEIEKSVLEDKLVGSKTSDARVKLMDDLFMAAAASGTDSGTTECPAVEDVLEKYGLRDGATKGTSPTAPSDPASQTSSMPSDPAAPSSSMPSGSSEPGAPAPK